MEMENRNWFAIDFDEEDVTVEAIDWFKENIDKAMAMSEDGIGEGTSTSELVDALLLNLVYINR